MYLKFPDEFDDSLVPAESLIPSTHQHLGIVRLFLPYAYQGQGNSDPKSVRWSELQLARSGFSTLYADDNFMTYLVPALPGFEGKFTHKDDDSAVLDTDTLAALNDATKTFGRLHGFQWADLDATPAVEERVELFGTDYDRFEFNGGAIPPPFRLPQFVVDENRQFAWGAHLFPDSIWIAAPSLICDQLLSDPRVDCALVAHSIPTNGLVSCLPPFLPSTHATGT